MRAGQRWNWMASGRSWGTASPGKLVTPWKKRHSTRNDGAQACQRIASAGSIASELSGIGEGLGDESGSTFPRQNVSAGDSFVPDPLPGEFPRLPADPRFPTSSSMNPGRDPPSHLARALCTESSWRRRLCGSSTEFLVRPASCSSGRCGNGCRGKTRRERIATVAGCGGVPSPQTLSCGLTPGGCSIECRGTWSRSS
jgi:hypothetical protein